MRPLALAVVLALFCALPVAAQYEDEQTRDYEERDRRYFEQRAERDQAAPPTDPTEASEALIKKVEELIRDRNYRSAKSERYFVQTDDPRLDARASAELLERFRDYFDRFWGDGIDLRNYETTGRVFLFYSFHKYNQVLAGDFRFSTIRPKGHYGSIFDGITLHTDADTVGGFSDSLIHEAAHQLIDRRIFGDDSIASLWLAEGLASYFGYTALDSSGEFQRGQVGGKAMALIRDTKPGSGEGAERLRLYKRAVKALEIEGPLVDRVVSIENPSLYYGSDPLINYTTSWLLVHYLLHGDEGRHADAFLRYVGQEVDGAGGPKELYSEIGLSAEELQAALERHTRKLKPR